MKTKMKLQINRGFSSLTFKEQSCTLSRMPETGKFGHEAVQLIEGSHCSCYFSLLKLLGNKMAVHYYSTLTCFLILNFGHVVFDIVVLETQIFQNLYYMIDASLSS